MGGVYAMKNKYVGLVRKPERVKLIDLMVYEMLILKLIIQKQEKESVDWNHPA